MTEEQAKTRWCPFARSFDPNDDGAGVAATNRPRSYNGSPRRDISCVASTCMAWRWHLEFPTSTVSGGISVISTGQPSTTRGYCGLAGQPS